MRVAVVTTGYGDAWNEEHLVTRRLAGALACAGDVDVLVARGAGGDSYFDGALKILPLPTVPTDEARAAVLRAALLGEPPGSVALDCSCAAAVADRLAVDLGADLQRRLVEEAGGVSPALWSRLADGGYDAAVFVGYGNAATHDGVAAVPPGCRTVLWPAVVPSPLFRMQLHDRLFERLDAVLAVTRAEEELVSTRFESHADRVHHVGFALHVNEGAAKAEPHGIDHGVVPVVVARDWRATGRVQQLEAWRDAIEDDAHPEKVRIRLVGPGADRLRFSGGVRLAASRTDVWRWMARSLAVLDPGRGVLGREVIEAMLSGIPVLVPAGGSASCHHVQAAHGGLWFHGVEELRTCVGALLDDDVASRLGEQGRDYARREFGDPDHFVKRVQQVVLG